MPKAKPAAGGPVFENPVFAEPGQSPDPLAFGTQHPSDSAVYAQVAALLKTQVVPFPPSRAADQPSIDCVTDEAGNRPAFLFHLGDVVYNFGESRCCYDQFYEPYRVNPAPAFAVPGNHGSFIIPGTPHGRSRLPPSHGISARRSRSSRWRPGRCIVRP